MNLLNTERPCGFSLDVVCRQFRVFLHRALMVEPAGTCLVLPADLVHTSGGHLGIERVDTLASIVCYDAQAEGRARQTQEDDICSSCGYGYGRLVRGGS